MMLASIERHVVPGLLRLSRPHGGLYLWCRLASKISARALLERALDAGVAFVPGHAFYPDPAGDSELRICFSSVLPDAIDQAASRLARSLSQLTAATPAVRRMASSA
jgi:2-aminoadipate transaminase